MNSTDFERGEQLFNNGHAFPENISERYGWLYAKDAAQYRIHNKPTEALKTRWLAELKKMVAC